MISRWGSPPCVKFRTKHKPTFIAYVDESGDEGFSFGRGSSDWFVLAAVITKQNNDLETVKLVDRVRENY